MRNRTELELADSSRSDESEQEIQAALLTQGTEPHTCRVSATLPGAAFPLRASADSAGEAAHSYSSAKVNLVLYCCFILCFICRRG